VAAYELRIFKRSLLCSLDKIKYARKFDGLTPGTSTEIALASRIRLCNSLLAELQAISCKLKGRMRRRDVKRRRSAIARHGRTGMYLWLSQSNGASRSRQRR
jgi:hypothetical protein